MEKSQLSLKARATGPDLKLNFWFDNIQVGAMSLNDQPQKFCHEFDDDQSDHVFEIELIGKQPEHTVLDAHGNIVHDRLVEISAAALDDIELGHMFYEQTRYYHNYNSVGEPTEHDFFGIMGCNGRVRLCFSSPVYLWLLENM